MYVLVRTEHGKTEFVARPGRDHSYTDRPQDAQIFVTHEEAERYRCGNEVIRTVEEAMR